MAVLHDISAVSHGRIAVGAPGADLSINVTMGSSGVNLLWIHIVSQDDASGPSGAFLSAVTVDGVDATYFASTENSGSNHVFYFKLSSGGSKTINIRADGDGGIEFILAASSYQNVDSVLPLGPATVARDATSLLIASVDGTDANNRVADAAQAEAHSSTDPGLATSAPQVSRWNQYHAGVVGGNLWAAHSDQPSAVSLQTMDWLEGTARPWSYIMAEVRFSSAVALPPLNLPVLGTG